MAMAAHYSTTTTTTTTRFHPLRSSNPHRSSLRQAYLPVIRCSSPKTLTLTLDPPPLFDSLTAFAPATVANLGPCFDFLGAAVSSLGDTVTASIDPSAPPGSISISSISGPFSTSKLTKNPNFNCAGIAAIAVMKMMKVKSVGISLSLHKGIPLGSGLGSSAASAAAAAVAVNALFGSPLSDSDLVLAGLESEKKVSGYHADNIAPAILGGFVLIQSYSPFKLLDLHFPEEKKLFFVLVSPEFEAPTKKMREVLPAEVATKDHIFNSSQAAALVAAVMRGDARALGEAMGNDRIVEPRRAPLIPGMAEVKRAANEAGAFGCTISGAGPTAVAVTDSEEMGREIGQAMVEEFLKGGKLRAKTTVAELDRVGARVVSTGAK